MSTAVMFGTTVALSTVDNKNIIFQNILNTWKYGTICSEHLTRESKKFKLDFRLIELPFSSS